MKKITNERETIESYKDSLRAAVGDQTATLRMFAYDAFRKAVTELYEEAVMDFAREQGELINLIVDQIKED